MINKKSINMYLLSTDTKYNDIYSQPAVYACGQTLMLGIELSESTNKTPTYVTVSDGEEEIRNLEMCNVEGDKQVIDLGPFIQSFFVLKDNDFYVPTRNAKEITVTVTNSGEPSDQQTLSLTFYALMQSVERGTSACVATPPLTTQATGETTGVFNADLLMNDRSTIFFPAGTVVTWTKNERYITENGALSNNYSHGNYNTSSSFSINYQKAYSGSTISMYRREVRLVPYCAGKTPLLRYVNKYGVYEYFVFDTLVGTEYNVEKGNRTHRMLTKNIDTILGDMQGYESTNTFTASVSLNDEDYAKKFKDLLSSRQVYLSIGTRLINETNWIAVELDGVYTTRKSTGTRASVQIQIKNDMVW